ncbi:uncharacterized protein F5147DRAFT_652732 [Suillus discolor]|uniref:Uncharacterized protein n=1 Tax=Suillus discolor TaxID=1912936 RepID=A0A9P7F820_9AGAM|nr:uncharacterized protein F5147DRAFT_652732 [Suillus discolor]KAG2108748.1 hypothetical protein F5147DRAFT_652732 [Suillus discolor]
MTSMAATSTKLALAYRILSCERITKKCVKMIKIIELTVCNSEHEYFSNACSTWKLHVMLMGWATASWDSMDLHFSILASSLDNRSTLLCVWCIYNFILALPCNIQNIWVLYSMSSIIFFEHSKMGVTCDMSKIASNSTTIS